MRLSLHEASRRARGLTAALVLAGLSACGTAPAAVVAIPPMPVSDTCGAAPYAHLVGQSSVALERTLIMRQVRILQPGQRAAEPVIPGRINFHLSAIPQAPDARPTRHVARIAAISCG